MANDARLNEVQRTKVMDEAFKLYQSASNFHWLTGADTLVLDSLNTQYEMLCVRMEALRVLLSDLQRECDTPTETVE